MMWEVSHRAADKPRMLADRHYSRQKPGTKHFVPPGRCLVLVTPVGDAVWVTSWPYAQYVRHAWAGAWVCSIFRNEGPVLSSTLINAAVDRTLSHWDEIPKEGFVTFVNEKKVRAKRNPGYCFLKAGFSPDGHTKGGLVALHMEYETLMQRKLLL